jgi:hypothetical protein
MGENHSPWADESAERHRSSWPLNPPKRTGDQSLTCKETALGDLRIRCTGRENYQMFVHYDPGTRLVTIKNTARPENEPDTILRIEGYAAEPGRDAHVVRNKEPNLDMLILGHLRVRAGLSRRAE